MTKASPDAKLDDVIKIAIMAVGGQGGGVLTGWIESLARAEGYDCQATSVAGVAQRTGATIYYIEMVPVSDRAPVFALAPTQGDVDVLIAAELMEAGRAVMRGFVTPDRTTLIASSHRMFAVSEKMAPGDGIARPDEVHAAAELASDRFICFDMERLAANHGSVISATLFGALAGSAVLPFPRSAFATAIRRGGRGVDPSLEAFETAFSNVAAPDAPKGPSGDAAGRPKVAQPTGSKAQLRAWTALLARAEALPAPALQMIDAGLRKVVEFMDTRYGGEYLDHLERIAEMDSTGRDFQLTEMAAKYIAKAMAYDDVIGVADFKTRGSRNARIFREMNADDDKLLHVTEFLHPRAEEIIGMMPAGLGRRWNANPRMVERVDRWFNKGRRIRSDQLFSFLMLYFLGGLKRYRRRTYRHAVEQAHLTKWLDFALTQEDYDLSVEILRCHRLVKGYSDTHARGLSKFEKVCGAVSLLEGRADASEWVARLREAALEDEDGGALDGAIATIRSFADEAA